MIKHLLVATATIALATPAIAAPLEMTTSMLVEQAVRAPDGTTRTTFVAPAKVVPGDRVVVSLDYRNGGAQPISNIVLANPLPAGIAYRAPSAGTPAPEVSVDGTSFGPLASLRVRAADGSMRAASAADVVSVRWRVAGPLAPKTGGKLSFQAVVK